MASIEGAPVGDLFGNGVFVAASSFALANNMGRASD